MPAYWISRCIINDPVSYKKYTDQVPAIIAKYGAKSAGPWWQIPNHGRP
jgi:uncharacterized protein (DUF1330 family)